MVTEIDTHALVKRLIATNFTEAQAEEVIKIVKEVRRADLDSIATKRDLEEYHVATKRDIKEYYYKTIFALGFIVVAVGGIIVAILN